MSKRPVAFTPPPGFRPNGSFYGGDRPARVTFPNIRAPFNALRPFLTSTNGLLYRYVVPTDLGVRGPWSVDGTSGWLAPVPLTSLFAAPYRFLWSNDETVNQYTIPSPMIRGPDLKMILLQRNIK